jgi:hypothetical protein
MLLNGTPLQETKSANDLSNLEILKPQNLLFESLQCVVDISLIKLYPIVNAAGYLIPSCICPIKNQKLENIAT